MNGYEGRRCRLRDLIAEGPRACLITNLTNIRYLCGFTGSAAALVVTADDAVLITDSRYELQAAEEAPECRLHIAPRLLDGVLAVVRAAGARTLGFEAEQVTVRLHEQLTAGLPGVMLDATAGLVEGLRMTKEPGEIERIAEAAELTDATFDHLCHIMRPGLPERQLLLETEVFMRQQGADGPAFPPIIAAGPRGALPHANPSERPLQAGDLVVVDIGARLAGYCSDLTRTVAIGRAADWQREIYRVCHAAQAAALAALRPGRPCAEVDTTARAVIEQAGYGERFGHGLGHSLGLETHEGPRLSRLEERSIAPGMVLTVEPGIYLPDRGGVRIEDLVEITADGHRLLSHAPKPAELPVLA